MLPAEFTAALLGQSLVLLSVNFAVLHFGFRFVGPVATIGLGLVIAALIGWTAYHVNAVCSVAPTFVPPACDDAALCGDGRMIFPCDGPLGLVTRAYSSLFAPLTALASIVLLGIETAGHQRRAATTTQA